ncbi:ECF transporter S component [Proteiniclasticum sp. SCR006]|uniref:ECF transporter S component n=1 Tax=Proteiniclasticum aestuarii TaxID=2817862 RepID=A0A939H3H5_9CLOT|nr:ECF transporter S component [Proteiniclasticum aestuarii]MBO1263492.1 ECF transporter S component [Proteiniclasticum aestuarii]
MEKIQSMTRNKSQVLVLMSLLVAFSYLGSLVKIQGTIALDALPAYLGALLLGPLPGAVIGFVGHLLTAVTSGFPMTLPMHLFIAILMALTIGIFGCLAEKTNNLFLAGLTGVFMNGPVSTLGASYLAAMLGLGFSGKVMFFALILPLSLTSLVNAAGAVALYKVLKARHVLGGPHEVS